VSIGVKVDKKVDIYGVLKNCTWLTNR